MDDSYGKRITNQRLVVCKSNSYKWIIHLYLTKLNQNFFDIDSF